MQHYVIKFVSDLRQVGDFLRIFRFPPPIKLTATIITEILLKVSLNTKTIFSTYIYLPAAKADINAPKLNNLFLYCEQFLTYTVAMVTPANKRPKMAKA